MRDAAIDMVENLSENGTNKDIHFGLVPFSHHVYTTLPSSMVLGASGATWTGCTQDRQYPYNTQSAAPTAGNDASKWGLNGFLFAWAKALRPHGIRVNGMCMGATDSWMIRDFYGFPQTPGEETEEQMEEVSTWMAKEDTAQVVIDLLEEGPEGRTAQNIHLCVGRPTKLEPALPNIYITEESLNVSA